MKRLIQKLFGLIGLEIKWKDARNDRSPIRKIDSSHLERIKLHPTNGHEHFKLAHEYFKVENYYTAWAELKTAESLGYSEVDFNENISTFKTKLPNLTQMRHNEFHRYATLRDIINTRLINTEGKVSVLDIGGGSGQLASFIPDLGYCLVEPAVNGIDGFELPFEDESFDFVVSCHVLEHIPTEQREEFLNQLVSKAKRAVILLNPIQIEKTLPTERLELFIEVTDADWAREHLDCVLPSIDYIQEYATRRKLKFTYKPSGSVTTTMALVLFDHLSHHIEKDKYVKVNEFLNTKYLSILDSPEYPNAGLFILEKA